VCLLPCREKKFANFAYYLIEPPGVREPTAWQLGKANAACLTTDQHLKHPLSKEDLKFLEWLKDKAQEVGAPGQR
jgi:hypothetical protein